MDMHLSLKGSPQGSCFQVESTAFGWGQKLVCAEAGEMMSALRKAFGPSRSETLTLEQELERLTEERLKLVLNIAQFVKMASGWDATTPYHVLVERMYGKMDIRTKRLVVAILQDADPREEPDTPAPDKKLAA